MYSILYIRFMIEKNGALQWNKTFFVSFKWVDYLDLLKVYFYFFTMGFITIKPPFGIMFLELLPSMEHANQRKVSFQRLKLGGLYHSGLRDVSSTIKIWEIIVP